MRVSKISKINTATYNNYSWPLGLEQFTDVNILLGWNGSGKTVISRIFKHLEIKDKDFIGETDTFTVEVDGNAIGKLSPEAFPKSVRVFNENYIKSMTASGSKLLPHVFYLGGVQVDYSAKETELSELKLKKKTCSDASEGIARSAISNIKAVDGIAKIKKEIETTGDYYSYTIESFKKRVTKIKEVLDLDDTKSISSFVLSDDELAEHREMLRNQSAQESAFNTLKKYNDWLVLNIPELQLLLNTAPTQQTSPRIDALDKDSKELKWVQEGVQIHLENSEGFVYEKCLFCNSVITNQEELQKHFSKDFLQLTNRLETIEGYTKNASEDLRKVVGFVEVRASIQAALADILGKINAKKMNFSSSPILSTFTPCFTQEEVYSSGNVSTSAWKIETHFVASVYEDFVAKEYEYNECVSEQKEIAQQLSRLESEIDDLKAKEADVHVPAEKLSRLVNTAFPYKQLEVKNAKSGIGYGLFRKGELCEFSSLSEGERNFIALAYFLISINNKKGENVFDENGVVVIDDPVSSLDKGAIFQIFSIILREMEVNSQRQYFLLTHSLDFYGHLLQSVYQKAKSKEEGIKCNLYQITYDQNGSKIEPMHKFLRDFKSDYVYTMSLLWGKKDNCDMSEAVLVANLMRRSWETFLRFKFSNPGSFGVMLQQGYDIACTERLSSMGDTLPDERKNEVKESFEEKRLAMYRFLNYGSHEYTDVDTSDESILQGVNERLTDFFEIVKLLDKHHYKKITTAT